MADWTVLSALLSGAPAGVQQPHTQSRRGPSRSRPGPARRRQDQRPVGLPRTCGTDRPRAEISALRFRRLRRWPGPFHPYVRVPNETARLRSGWPVSWWPTAWSRPPAWRPGTWWSQSCCIRENADQRLYGTLGRLKELVDAKPGLQIAVGGCLAQKDRERIQEKVGWVDVVFGTHNLTSAPGLLRRAETEGPVMEILDAPAPESGSNPLLGTGAVRELPYAAWVNIQTGCDNSCAFCIVPSVRGPR